MLRKGSAGREVRTLQETLNRHGAVIRPDGKYGPQTEFAVRAFQRRKGMLPDGIAGPKTYRALGIGAPTIANAAPHINRFDETIKTIGGTVAHVSSNAKLLPPPPDLSRPGFCRSISQQGLQFIFDHEALIGVSNRLHWPRGASGVTLGPGYDMKERSSASIVADMQAIGLDTATASQISKAAGLMNHLAEDFAVRYKSIVNLTRSQEIQLLKHVVPRYESIVRRLIQIDLLQCEFDALVSFAYNPGGRFQTVAHHVNEGQVADAMKTIKLAVTSRGTVMKGLVNRRNQEVSLYLYGDYQGIGR